MPNYVEMSYPSITQSTNIKGKRFNLNQDVQLELVTSTQDLREFFPSLVTKILDFVKKAGQAVGEGNFYLESSMGMPIWDKTDPIRLNLELFFYTKTDPIADVLEPIFDLCSICLPIQSGDRYMLPFVNILNTMSSLKKLVGSSIGQIKGVVSGNKSGGLTTAQAKAERDKLQAGALKDLRFIELRIPGVIELSQAFIMKATPIFSKEVTESGAPLWGQLNLEIRSFQPATANMLLNSVQDFRDKAARAFAIRDSKDAKLQRERNTTELSGFQSQI